MMAPVGLMRHQYKYLDIPELSALGVLAQEGSNAQSLVMAGRVASRSQLGKHQIEQARHVKTVNILCWIAKFAQDETVG